MKRWFPAPRLSVVLLIIWLLVNQSIEFATILVGAILAIVIPYWFRAILPENVLIRRPWVIVRLVVFSMIEIVRSCFNVSLLILFRRRGHLNSQFITVPLDLRSPAGLAVLSGIINTTPGTVWVELLPDTYDLALHVFDLHDEQWWIDTIKTRYEQPLIEIFEGRDAV
ncbi:Na+/H+ antiporter subunit E [Saccharophagus sp. K07]|uniref:Na+/H+ antiporter subunit E n=1 Tax=Saccharophagus sp. K07 TaxID=2283636 RepID=UPI001652B0ED|nr:Na+/H+ antiporter subunit E [Saccharophagus sp. K07]MBC6904372.1 Na+/H+ antiporter subunit E [Saccharophagus sp. K07]